MLELRDALKVLQPIVSAVSVNVVNVIALGDWSNGILPDVPMQETAPWVRCLKIAAMLPVPAFRIPPIAMAAILDNFSLWCFAHRDFPC